MRQLATIQKVEEVQPIEGADRIVRIRVKNWWLIALKDEFKVGDQCVYHEIDSLCPKDNPIYQFLDKGNTIKTIAIDGKEYSGYRLKTIKLRGQISQGLAIPIERFKQEDYFKTETKNIGDDVSDELGIVKWEMPIPAALSGKIKGNFPSFIPKTDEERVQNLGDLLIAKRGTDMYATEKLDGSSATFYKKNNILGVCSRNLELLETPENTFWQVARAYNLETRLPEGFAIQGELVGPGIQQNRYKLGTHQLWFFNAFDIEKQQYLDMAQMMQFFDRLNLPMVPFIGEDIFELRHTPEKFLAEAEGPSFLNPEIEREGIVIRPCVEQTAVIGGTLKRFSFKAISIKFLLTNKE